MGKLFVEAAESIREASVSYDSAIDAVKQELSEAKAEISALKEQVSHHKIIRFSTRYYTRRKRQS